MDFSKINDGLKYYEVRFEEAEHGICEDGQQRRRPGYQVVNKETGVVEHTTVLMPGAIFQAQHLDATLDGLLNPEEVIPSLESMPIDDVVAN